MKATRVFQLTALALVVVSAVQVGWWLYDQHAYTQERLRLARGAYAGQTAAAQALLDSGTSAGRVHELLPAIAVTGGHAALDPAVDARLLTEARHRSNQYAWEGAFFLLALGVCIAVIALALRAGARVLEEQDSFLALVSHQFKTPLASLQLSLETMALRGLAPERASTLIERMLADLARMEAMVTQILESVRLERGRVDLKSEPLELGAAVARVVATLEERARQQRVAITSDIAPRLYVLADPLALDVIVRNLLENALAAVTPVGG
ncbi:MAG: HAMP domain-containing sensor histidine kinase, partial [Steroidobacteraceae bacterium]